MKTVLLASCLALFCSEYAHAQTGWLDSTFNNNGIAIASATSSIWDYKQLVIQNDDKAIVAGHDSGDIKVMRYNTDGSVDLSFGTAGIVVLSFSVYELNDMILQPDGKILLASNSNIIRLHTDGTFDTSFDLDGVLELPVGHSALALGLQSNGNIAVAVHDFDSFTFNAVVRAVIYNPAGVLLSSNVAPTDGYDYIEMNLIVQPDDKIILYWGQVTLEDAKLFRVNSDGTSDVTYGPNNNGVYTFSNQYAWFDDAIINSNGDLFISSYKSGELRFVQIDSNGLLDASFGTNGRLDIPLAHPIDKASMAVLADGKVLISGGTQDYIITRLDSNLVLDTTFSQDGQVTIDVTNTSTNERTGDLGIQSNGQLVVTGGTNTNFGTIRLKSQCTPIHVIDTVTLCYGESHTWIDGVTYTANNDSALVLYQEAAINGCDSIITLNLTVLPPFTETEVQTACDSFTWIDGITYTSSTNSPTHTLTSTQGCDSLITLDLTMTNTPVATLIDNGDATLSTTGLGIYQWIDCGNSNALIPGATATTFTPSVNGEYAVIVSNGNCSDTSNCLTIDNVGFEALHEISWNLFPNPTSNAVTITLSSKSARYTLYDTFGNVLKQGEISSGDQIHLDDFTNGIYFFEIRIGDTVARMPITRN